MCLNYSLWSFGVTLMEYNAKCPTIFKNAQNSDLCNDFFCNCFFHLNLKGYCPLLWMVIDNICLESWDLFKLVNKNGTFSGTLSYFSDLDTSTLNRSESSVFFYIKKYGVLCIPTRLLEHFILMGCVWYASNHCWAFWRCSGPNSTKLATRTCTSLFIATNFFVNISWSNINFSYTHKGSLASIFKFPCSSSLSPCHQARPLPLF